MQLELATPLLLPFGIEVNQKVQSPVESSLGMIVVVDMRKKPLPVQAFMGPAAVVTPGP